MNVLSLFRNEKNPLECVAGEVIFPEGVPGDCMYVVLEGKVQIKKGDNVVDTLEPGELFGEMALIDSSPRSAAAVAASDCKLAVVDQRRFDYLVSNTPFFAIHIMTIMAERLRKQLELSAAT